MKKEKVQRKNIIYTTRAFLIVVFTFSFFLFNLKTAHAGLLIKPPLYIGLNSGLVGNWSFDQPDIAVTTAYDRSGNANNGTYRASVNQTFTTTGDQTWTAPTGVTKVTVEAWGGGGAGAGAASNGDDGGGGAGGQYATKNAVSVTPGTGYTVHVATTKAGVIGNGSAGDDSTFNSTTVVAKGGAGGTLPSTGGSGSASGGVGDTVYAGGSGGNGASGKSGGGGGGAGSTGNGGSASVGNAGTGTSVDGGTGGDGISADGGLPGQNYGGAGGGTRKASGAIPASAGGTGAQGEIKLTYQEGTFPNKSIGRIGQAFTFNGVSSDVWVSQSSSINDLNSITVSAWVYVRRLKASSAGTDNAILCKGSSTGSADSGFWCLTATSTNAIQFQKDYATTDLQHQSSNNSISLNTWQHVVMMWDGSATAANVRIYVNGTEVSYQTTTNGAGAKNSDASLDLTIGNDGSALSALDGLIDDVRVYNRALSAQEVKRLYNIGGTLHIAASQNQKLTNGLVGLWSFDQNDIAGTVAYDRSGNANNGTLTNGPVPAIGKIGQGLSFISAANQYVDTANITAMNGATQLTIAMWFRRQAIGSEIAVGKSLNVSNQIVIDAFTDGNVYLIPTQNPTQYAGFSSNDTDWHHVVMVFNGNESGNARLKGYLDGIEKNMSYTGTPPATTANNSVNFTIGGTGSGITNGTIDDVRIYNRALSAQEVKRLYNIGGTLHIAASQNQKLTNGLVGLWSFDQSDLAGTVAYDRSGNANNGTLTNGPVRAIGKIGQGLSFDGVNDYVTSNAASSINNLKNMSISAWVYTRSFGLSNSGAIVSKSNGTTPGWSLAFDNASPVRLLFIVQYTGNALWRRAVAGALPFNTWTHVLVTRDGSDASSGVHIYINGQEVSYFDAQEPTGSQSDDSGQSLEIGRTTPNVFDGSIDDVRIYNRALSAQEVTRLYNMGR